MKAPKRLLALLLELATEPQPARGDALGLGPASLRFTQGAHS